jgi:hypothetical protein
MQLGLIRACVSCAKEIDMTVPHRTSPLAAPSVQSAVELLRSRGLRASSARRLVLEALFAAERPLTAEEIAAGLEGWLPSAP